MTRLSIPAFACTLLMLLTGCSSSTKPGDVQRVQISSDAPRAGNVYLLRGWIGIFSAGIDQLGEKLNAAGIRSTVYQEDQWHALADEIQQRYAGHPEAEPLILIGHSYGADSAVRVSQVLRERNIPVTLVITLDPVTPPKVPANVLRTYNLYQSNGVMDAFPWLRGIALEAEPDNKHPLANLDIRRDRKDLLASDLDHFNIEKQPQIHYDVIKQVMSVCPPRNLWRMVRSSSTATPLTRAPATQPKAGGS